MSKKIWISTGVSRKDMKWKNREVTWEWLIGRLGETKRTSETIEEYLEMSKDAQDSIKDVGGFVGGVIQGGRRKASSIQYRDVLTLDVDKGYLDLFEDIKLTFDVSMCMYSTHKHTEKAPRMRIVIPLSRDVHGDEYEAVGRKFAELIDIEIFDPTTFQPERLMYWPSTARNGQFLYDSYEGSSGASSSGWLDADEMLGKYSDWKDTSQWAYSVKVQERIKRVMTKQGDPLERPGVVGVFNKTYGIEEAIEKFLGEVYIRCDSGIGDGSRWTYVAGSTSGGLVVYDNLFAFSHHSTDPISGRLVNAFDLVRLHKFGELDEGMENSGRDVPGNRLKSFGAMSEWAYKDDEVKKMALEDGRRSAADDFERVEDSGGKKEDLNWLKKLDVDKKGNCYNTIQNIVVVLTHDARLKDCLAWNDFDKKEIVMRDLPWRKVKRLSREFVDSDSAALRNYLEKLYRLTNSHKIEDAVSIVARKNSFHPVRSYLKGLEWDGEERVETMLIDYLGAENSVYIREVTKKMLVAAVGRIYDPGCKFDYALTLVGKTGIGKSFLIGKLAGEWGSDTFGNLENKDGMEQLAGVWIMEIGELAGLRKSRVEAVKLFISKREDRFRVAFGRRVEAFPRQCIFIPTTNEDQFLSDPTGNRRFWPVKVGVNEPKCDVFKIKQSDIDQIWAEAVYLYSSGEDLFLTPEIEAEARIVQEHHYEHDERADEISEYLQKEVPDNWYDLGLYERRAFLEGDETVGEKCFVRYKICVQEIWTELFKKQIGDMSFYNTKFVRDAMKKMPQWQSRLVKIKGIGTVRGYAFGE